MNTIKYVEVSSLRPVSNTVLDGQEKIGSAWTENNRDLLYIP